MKTLKLQTAYKSLGFSIAFMFMHFMLLAQAPAPTTITNIDGTWKLEPDGKNGMRVTFTPDPAAVTCPDIRLIQTVKRTFYNAAGVATVATVVNGLTPKKFKFKEPGMIPGGTGVDHVFCEKDPFYNGTDSGKDAASKGVGPTGAPTTMWDAPNYRSETFPDGMVKVKLEFEVCAICRSGPFAGVSYGCVKWEFIQEKGQPGTSTLVGVPPAITPRTQEHVDATAKFVETHTAANGDSICPEEVAIIKAIENALKFLPWYIGINLNDSRRLFKSNQTYEVVYATSGVRKGPANLIGALPTLPIGTTIAPNEMVFVPSGEDLCLRRVSTIPILDPQIPFPAAWSDLYYGEQEIVEEGLVSPSDHSGIRVKNCSGTTLCAVTPSTTTNPFGLIMYSVEINNQTQQVIINNNLASTHPLMIKNVFNNLVPQNLAPGNTLTLNYPGQLPACASKLKLKLFIEGYFNGGTGMVPALLNQGVASQSGISDSLTIDLHSAFPPFPILASTKTLLNQNGDVVCDFPAISSPVFIAIRHRSAIETWSANPINFNQGLAMYDFTTSANNAFGANQVQVAPGVWALYSGDVNHDQSIDLLDVPMMENDINNFEFGYNHNDINGDGSVDLLDANILELNISNFIFANIPN